MAVLPVLSDDGGAWGGGTLSTPPGLYAEVVKALLFFHIRFKTCSGKRTYALGPFQCLAAPSVHAQTLLITYAPTGPSVK
jgi:hypothetical protein